MFLSTVREIIVINPKCLTQYIQNLMPLYLAQSNHAEEYIRNIVAESIGKLFITHPQELTPFISTAFSSNDVNTVATYAKSFKYSAHNNEQPQYFAQFIMNLIQLIGNSDLSVKRYSLESLSMIFYNIQFRPILEDKVQQVIEITLRETPVKQELITAVDLGPFKYNVDNGAPIRKAAFVLLENVTEKYINFD